MTRIQRFTDRIASLLFLAAVTVYFSVWYGFHTINQEQLQLFEWTWDYFAEIVVLPGGFSDYLSRFLTQFCYYSWPGGLIIASLLVLIRITLRALCLRKDSLAGAMTFIPSILLMIVMCYRFPTLNLLVAFLLSLTAALAVTKIRNRRVRHICSLALVPVLYLLTGSFALLFAAVTAVREHNRLFGSSLVLLAAACPFIAFLFLPYPLGRLLYGLHYYKVHVNMPVWPWVAVLAAVAIVAFAETTVPASKRNWPLAYLATAAVAIAAVLLSSSQADEQSLKYNILAGKRSWNRIVTEATRQAPETYSETACLNLALCKTGHLGGHMFDYLQDGPETLLPNENTPHHDGLSTAEIFYQLGMVNNARRNCFEALNAIPDYQKSAPVFKLLAEISLVNENYEMARKYLKTLGHTLFYRSWARQQLALLQDSAGPFVLDEYTQKRFERYKGEDYIFDYNNADISLRQLLVEYPGNLTALNYLLAWNLLTKDPVDFVGACPFEAYTSAVPKVWQEGFLIERGLSGYSPEDLPDFIAPENAARYGAFIRDFNANVPMDKMQRNYGDTYWFYYFFK